MVNSKHIALLRVDLMTRLLTLSVVISCGMVGCSKGPKLPTVSVSGTVSYQGKPLEGAQIGFVPPSSDGKSANGVTDAQGNFTLQTYLGGTSQASGAMPGDYTVVIRKDEGAIAGAGPAGTGPPPPRSSEEMRKEMQERSSGQLKAPPGPKLLTPQKYASSATSPLKATVKPSGNEPFKFDLTD